MRKNKMIIGLAIIITYASMLCAVNAYVLSGKSWGSGDLDPLNYHSTSQYSTALDDSVDDWNDENHDGGDFNEVSTSSAADVHIRDVDLAVSWAGRTGNIPSGSTIIASGVELNEYHLDDYSNNERRCTIAHELGHVWGLGHEDDDQIRALMYSWHEQRWYWGIYVPQNDDVNGVNAIY